MCNFFLLKASGTLITCKMAFMVTTEQVIQSVNKCRSLAVIPNLGDNQYKEFVYKECFLFSARDIRTDFKLYTGSNLSLGNSPSSSLYGFIKFNKNCLKKKRTLYVRMQTRIELILLVRW